MAQMPIGAAVRRLAEQQPDRPAITCEGETVLWRDLEPRTNRLAHTLERLGVGQGDFVTIGLPNGIAFYETCIAAWKLGATPQPISSRLPERERDEIVALVQPALVVTEPIEPDADASDEPILPDRIAPAFKAPTSGGSTGRPKIIVSGQDGTTDPDTRRSRSAAGGAGQTELVAGPLYHNGPFVFSVPGLLSGGHLVVMTRFDASEALELIERHRVEWMMLVPTMMLRIWRLPEAERLGRDVSSLRAVLHLAAPCPAWLKHEWINWLGADAIWELYAGTEAQGVTLITGDEWLQHEGSVGRPLPGRMKITDDEGNELPAGEIGEIWMKPPDDNPTYRYIGAEARARDGWESIGDLGLDGRRRLPLPRRSAHRPDPRGRSEHLSRRGGGGVDGAPGDRHVRGDRLARRGSRPACARGAGGDAATCPTTSCASSSVSAWCDTRCRGASSGSRVKCETMPGKVRRSALAAERSRSSRCEGISWMSDTWETVGMSDVGPGDRVRYRDYEFTIARVDSPFLGVETMVCLIEDEPTRWFAYPGPAGRPDRSAAVVVSRAWHEGDVRSTTPPSTTTGAAAGRRWCSRTARSTTAGAGRASPRRWSPTTT